MTTRKRPTPVGLAEHFNNDMITKVVDAVAACGTAPGAAPNQMQPGVVVHAPPGAFHPAVANHAEKCWIVNPAGMEEFIKLNPAKENRTVKQQRTEVSAEVLWSLEDREDVPVAGSAVVTAPMVPAAGTTPGAAGPNVDLAQKIMVHNRAPGRAAYPTGSLAPAADTGAKEGEAPGCQGLDLPQQMKVLLGLAGTPKLLFLHHRANVLPPDSQFRRLQV
ncbi:hypothetical protein CYMTET_55995 [Cymbomonas tetramitiformis]|uniref:Uncharacterized protein n=1 Tax=Cymbomonas tetramitiformis TaxID=36881 RepID=A0AAE0BDA3_9CHLO|nr:hypothetical protein CYMTET_55995 [Cymbomonas tetramitiformis]